MTGPCQYGFECPHTCWGEDGDRLCIHPYTPALADFMRAMEVYDEDQLFPMVDEIDCPLMDADSELQSWLTEQEEKP